MKKVFFATILLVLLASSVSAYAAGIPSILSYQGRLTDSGGNLLGSSAGTTYYFKFSIWDNPTSDPITGNRLWPSTGPSTVTTTVRQGVFNVDIGDTTNGSNALNYNFNTSKDIYLQIEVSTTLTGTFEVLSPRQRISSAPFAQISGAVSGIGQSSFGTTTPFGTSVVSIQSTSTQSTSLSIGGVLGQLANLFQIQDSTGANLFTVDNNGKVGVGTGVPARKLNVVDTTNSVPQLRLSQTSSAYGEFEVNSAGDLMLSSSADTASRNAGYGGNIRMQDENLWVCSGGACNAAAAPAGEGNIIVQNGVVFNNKFVLKYLDASTTIMYDTTNNPIFEFDEGQ